MKSEIIKDRFNEKERVLIEIYKSGLQGLVSYEESREFLEEIYNRMELPNKKDVMGGEKDENRNYKRRIY